LRKNPENPCNFAISGYTPGLHTSSPRAGFFGLPWGRGRLYPWGIPGVGVGVDRETQPRSVTSV